MSSPPPGQMPFDLPDLDAERSEVVDAAAASKIRKFMSDQDHSPVHNFTGDTASVWRRVSQCTGGAALKSDDARGKKIPLCNWYVHRVDLSNSETGEVVSVPRVCLVDSTGAVYGFVSSGICESLICLTDVFGDGVLDPPVEITIAEYRTRLGRRTLSIQPA